MIDFSCFIPSDMKSAVLGMNGVGVGLYVYISTDSVYEVTQAKYVDGAIDTEDSYQTDDSFSSFDSYSSSSSSDSIEYTIERRDEVDLEKNPKYYNPSGLILEEYAFHNKRNHRFRNYLLKMDAYGFEKFQCEYVLKKNAEQADLKYLILRLPDVIGPYDDSARFWKIVLQMSAILKLREDPKAVDTLKFEFAQEEIDSKLSFVSSLEVSGILQSLISANCTGELAT